MKDQDKNKAQLVDELTGLRRAHEHYRQLLDEMSDGYVITRDGQILFANRPMAQMLKCAPDALLGRPWKEFFAREMADYLDSTPMVDLPLLLNARSRRLDGSELDVELAVRPATFHGKLAEFTLVRDVTARKHAEQMLRQRNRELALLNQMGQELATMLDVTSIMEQLLPAVIDIVGAQGAAIWLWNPERDIWSVRRALLQGSGLDMVDLEMSPASGVADWVLQYEKSLAIPDAQRDPRSRASLYQARTFTVRTLLAAPLWARGQVIGVLEVTKAQPDDLKRTDRTLIETLAASAGSAIGNARLFETLRQRNRELALLNKVGRMFLSTLDQDEMLVTALEKVRQLLDVVACSIWLVDSTRGELVCRQATGPRHELVCGWRLAWGEGLVGWVAQHGKSLNVPDVHKDPRHFKGVDQRTGLPLRAILTVPLQVKGQMLGVIQAVDARVGRFTPANLTLIESLAATAAAALENARLHEKVRQDAAEIERQKHERET